ncbi:hypothetical protein ACA910_013148 [Epithemia clementina (nom. ined.)]
MQKARPFLLLPHRYRPLSSCVRSQLLRATLSGTTTTTTKERVRTSCTAIRPTAAAATTTTPSHQANLLDLLSKKEIPNGPIRIAFGSCSDQAHGDLSYFDKILNKNPDLMILMGDNVYDTTSDTAAVVLDDTTSFLKKAYQDFGSHPSVHRFLSKVPVCPVLDDNDYGTDMETAKDLFLDFFAVDQSDERRQDGRGVFHSFTIGGEYLQVILLDVRRHATAFSHNSSNKNRDSNDAFAYQGPFLSKEDASCTILGKDQWFWLDQQLQKSAQIRILVSPTQVLPTCHGWDCWNLFPHERARLLGKWMSCSSTNKIILSGDRHFGAIYRYSSSSSSSDDIIPNAEPADNPWEVTSSSLTHSVPEGMVDHEIDDLQIGGPIYGNNFGLLQVHTDGTIEVTLHSTTTGETLRSVQIQPTVAPKAE